MRAVLLRDPKPIEQNPLTIEDVPSPNVGDGQVLVKIGACGVCRSNLHMIEGDWVDHGVPAKSPIIPGHEIAGKIVALGNGVAVFQEGDRVGIQPLWSSCGTCEYCLTGREYLCPSKQITGETRDGGYAEYIVANTAHLYAVPANLNDSEAAPLFCPGLTAYGAVTKAGLAPGKRVGIFGIGGVSHIAVQLARLYGADVIAVTRSSQHLKLAEELGASTVVDVSHGSQVEWLKSIGSVDSSIVFAPSSSMAQLAVKATKLGGTVVMGVYANLGDFQFVEEKRILGSVIGSRNDMKQVLSLAGSGRIKVMYDEFKLEQADKALKMLKKSELRARAVLVP
jgi:propanol-preferring alcohol dehydrogenase